MNIYCSSRLSLLVALVALAALVAAPAVAGEWPPSSNLATPLGDYRPGSVDGRYRDEAYRYSSAPSPRMDFRGGDIDARQERQRDRIWRGWQRGVLTRHEMRELMAEQRAIANKERYYLADGHLSRREYADLQADLDSASRRLYHAKHDNDWRARTHWHRGY